MFKVLRLYKKLKYSILCEFGSNVQLLDPCFSAACHETASVKAVHSASTSGIADWEAVMNRLFWSPRCHLSCRNNHFVIVIILYCIGDNWLWSLVRGIICICRVISNLTDKTLIQCHVCSISIGKRNFCWRQRNFCWRSVAVRVWSLFSGYSKSISSSSLVNTVSVNCSSLLYFCFFNRRSRGFLDFLIFLLFLSLIKKFILIKS